MSLLILDGSEYLHSQKEPSQYHQYVDGQPPFQNSPSRLLACVHTHVELFRLGLFLGSLVSELLKRNWALMHGRRKVKREVEEEKYKQASWNSFYLSITIRKQSIVHFWEKLSLLLINFRGISSDNPWSQLGYGLLMPRLHSNHTLKPRGCQHRCVYQWTQGQQDGLFEHDK